jgi:hypothetical protein
MRQSALDAVAHGTVTASISKVDTSGPAPIAAIVEGQLAGCPFFIDPTPGSAFMLDTQGLPIASGTRTAPFRVVVPVGTGDYPFVMYLHGTGGTYEDTTFDTEIAGNGVAKVSIQLDGWTPSDAVQTLIGFTEVFQGTHHAVAMLVHTSPCRARVRATGPRSDPFRRDLGELQEDRLRDQEQGGHQVDQGELLERGRLVAEQREPLSPAPRQRERQYEEGGHHLGAHRVRRQDRAPGHLRRRSQHRARAEEDEQPRPCHAQRVGSATVPTRGREAQPE